MEIIEEDRQEEQSALDPAIPGDTELTSTHTNGLKETDSDLDQTVPPLQFTHEQLLQANMDVIAAHASNKQLMAAHYAAVLGLGGGANPNTIPQSML